MVHTEGFLQKEEVRGEGSVGIQREQEGIQAAGLLRAFTGPVCPASSPGRRQVAALPHSVAGKLFAQPSDLGWGPLTSQREHCPRTESMPRDATAEAAPEGLPTSRPHFNTTL